jgi:hypothetical protein
MWVWVAMRCFFDVDCTSSILIAAAAAGFCAVCLSPAGTNLGEEQQSKGKSAT